MGLHHSVAVQRFRIVDMTPYTISCTPLLCYLQRSFFANEPLIIGLFCGKRPKNIRHPMRLHHPVAVQRFRIVDMTPYTISSTPSLCYLHRSFFAKEPLIIAVQRFRIVDMTPYTISSTPSPCKFYPFDMTQHTSSYSCLLCRPLLHLSLSPPPPFFFFWQVVEISNGQQLEIVDGNLV